MIFLLLLWSIVIAEGTTSPKQRPNEPTTASIGGIYNSSNTQDQKIRASFSGAIDGLFQLRAQNFRNLGYSIALEPAKPFMLAGPSKVTDNIIPLTNVRGTSPSQKYLQILSFPDMDSGSAPIKTIQDGPNGMFMASIKFGNQEFTSVLDTGSSDTWVVGSGFKCVDRTTKRVLAARACRFGSTYNKTNTYVEIPDQHFNTSYTDGEFMNGVMASETVTLGNITVTDQHFGLVNSAAWVGDGKSSGLIGLAFPSITNAYPGTDPAMDRKGANTVLALNRVNEGPGALALGGLPGTPIRYASTFAHAPMQYFTVKGAPARSENGIPSYTFYVINADGFTINSESSPLESMKTQLIIDTGTPLTYLPADIAKAVNNAWSPAARLDPFTRQYLVNCQSAPPKFGMKLNGTTIWFDSKDLAVPAVSGGSGTLCVSGIQAVRGGAKGAGGLSILGGTFLKSVVAVFDVGAAEMRFANRVR